MSTPLRLKDKDSDDLEKIPRKCKKKRTLGHSKLSFSVDEESSMEDIEVCKRNHHGEKMQEHEVDSTSYRRDEADQKKTSHSSAKKNVSSRAKSKLLPNTNLPYAPKALTKAALLREAQTRENLRKEFLILQEAIKRTEIEIPFVFYDGTNIPGGSCRVRKGDNIWVFLDRCRKAGAELKIGVKANSRRQWARIGVDDLMLVRGDLIIPHVSVIFKVIISVYSFQKRNVMLQFISSLIHVLSNFLLFYLILVMAK